MERVQGEAIQADLHKKMVFITGPRQAGKTTLAKSILKHYSHPAYLNYDQLTDRNVISKQNWLANTDLLVFDELHKMPNWKNYLKGLYDTKKKNQHILITGS